MTAANRVSSQLLALEKFPASTQLTYPAKKGDVMRYVLPVIFLILCIASRGLSAEFHGFTCATGWNQLTLEQKQYFMVGLNEGIIAGIVASDVPEANVDKVFARIWPGRSSVEDVLALIDVACGQLKNRDLSLVLVLFTIADAAREK